MHLAKDFQFFSQLEKPKIMIETLEIPEWMKKVDDDIVILGSTCVFEVYSSESMYKKIAPLLSFFKVKNKNSLD